ncbi:MAG: InlB B-repeat-containing protein, partial [Clostridia bacterium]|nr:InlB B-repeat-containing protein [Clostridia bacterium]
MNRKNKLLVLLTVLLLVFGVAACGDNTPDVPTTDGKEIGSYYYDTGAEDYIVSLMDGMKASFTAKGATQNGTYTLVDGTLTLKLEGSTISASYGNDTVSMIYEGRALTFIRMVNYKVSFKTADGEEIAEKDVIGGKKVEAPEAPEKENAVFIGWYADSECTVPFNFSEAITAETTVYARYAAIVEGQVEYDVTLMVDGNKLATKTTIGGVVYNLPTPTAAGKTFAGWWMSAYQDAEKLTCKYEEQKIGEDSVLYAVWAEDLNVSVYADGIVISAPGANNTYDIVISDAEGNVLHSEKTGYANVAYDFAAQGTGAYTVAVTLKGETFTAYYCQNALNRVTEIEVEGNVLSFEPVANGRGYYVTVDCGNDAHQHTFVPLGNATEYDFSACDMQEGGIVFTIYAAAEGYITSTSAPFVVERNLPAVEGLAYALDNESISWNAVEGAESYVITVTKGNETATYTVNGSVTTYSLKGYNGRVTVNVTAMAKGFNPSEAEIIFVNDRLLAPETIWLEGKALAWTQVEGAVSYNIKIGDKVFTSATNSLTLTDEHYTDGVSAYVISVQAVAAVADKNSLYSASYTFRSGSMADTLVYENGAVTWEYVLDASKYGVKVNDGEETIVSAASNSAKVAFAQAGANTVSVRCYDENGAPSAWVNVSVTAYEITFNTQGGDEMASIFVANGDEVDLTEAYYEGYVFNGWYSVAEGGEQIEKPWDAFVFEAGKSVELYAY